jgi:[protein-PII] uridylyltransferase
MAGQAGRELLADEDLAEVREASGFLAGCRIVAHGLAGSRADRLDYQLQGRLAAALGYRPGEDLGAAALLMRDIFTALRAVGRALKSAAPEYEEESAWGGRRKTAADRRRSVAGDFTRIGGRLYLARPDLFEGRDGALRMMQGLAAAARSRLTLSREFQMRVRDNLYAVGDELRESAEAAGLFREILRTRAGAAGVLRAMHESGFLGAYLPEFAEIECLITTDVYHEYTVDEHSLMAVAALDAAERGAPGTPELAAALCSQVPAMDVVKLAALLHDLGKAKAGSGHEERAGVMLPRIAKQLRLAEDEARLAIFLVENHQLLADAAGSRLTSDEKLLSGLAECIGEGARLDALYLLTWADLSAVAAAPLAAWRSEQLAALHRRLAGRLAARPARSRGRLAEELRATLPADAASVLADHLSKVPERYLLEVSPEEAALHLRLLAEMAAERERPGGAAEPVAVDFHRRAAHVHFWVLGPDRPRRFSQICGAFMAAGASIFGARAYTRSDGVIIDQFDVVDAAAPDSGGSDEFWRRAAATVREVLSGRSDLAALVAAARSSPAGAAPVRRDVPARVAFDNAVSADCTVIDVSCADRVGLLYDFCGALSDSGADIAFAKIATEGGVATDCFYVTAGGGKITGREEMSRIRSAVQACREPRGADGR